MKSVYEQAKSFKEKYSKTVAFRLKKHAAVLEEHLNPEEKVLFVCCAQNNYHSYMIINSCVLALTNKRIIICQKRLLWGYYFTTITPDLYTDLKVKKNIIWSDIEIDTLRENVYLSNIDPKGAVAIETAITDFMMEAKKHYEKDNN